MATLLMRTPELSSSTDNVGLSNHAHARLHVSETAPCFSRLPPPDVPLGRGPSSCTGRTRRAKSVHKKQPQRGLGVAQLEKLRLQEQSKQEAASLATLQCVQSLPPNSSSYSFSEPCSTSLCFQGSIVCHVKGSSALHLLAEPCLVPSLSLATPAGTSFLPLPDAEASHAFAHSNSPQSFSGSSVRQVSSMPVMVGRLSDDECAFSSLDLCSPSAPVAAIRERAVSKGCGVEKLDTGTPGESEAASRLASRVMGGPITSIKHTTNSSLLSAMFGERGDAVEGRLRSQEGEEGVLLTNTVEAEGGTDALRLYPIMTFAKEGRGTPCTFMDFGFSDRVQLSANPSQVQRSRCPLPKVGSDKHKELSSFQSFASNGVWSSGEKILGRKRPWIAMQDRHNCPGRFDLLDLNDGDDEEALHMMHENLCAVSVLDDQSGVHYTTGIVRTALGKTSCMSHGKIKQPCSTSQWQDSSSPSSGSGCPSDMSVFPTPSSFSKICTGKDSCSSASPSSLYSVGRIGCLDAEEVLEIGVLPASENDFLSLGLSSCGYSVVANQPGTTETTQTTDHYTAEQDGLKYSTVIPCLKDKPRGKCQVANKAGNPEVDADDRLFSSNTSPERNLSCCTLWTTPPVLSTAAMGPFTKVPLTATATGLEAVPDFVYREKNDDLDLSLKLAL